MSHIDFSTGSLKPSFLRPSLRDELGTKNVTTLSVKKGLFMILMRMPSFHSADYLLVAAFHSRESALSKHLPLRTDMMTREQTTSAAVALHKWAQKRKRIVEIDPEYRLIEESLLADSDYIYCKGSSNHRRQQRRLQFADIRRDQRTEQQFWEEEGHWGLCL